MIYVLKHCDTPLLRFEMAADFSGVTVTIRERFEAAARLLPLDLQPTDEGLRRWLRNRTIPANRAYVENLLARFGLNERDTIGIIDLCKGLSLNDCYWVTAEDFVGAFAAHNLYENRFSTTIAQIAFTGHGSANRPSGLRSSPEFTTNGMLAKCWRRVGGEIVLYKSGTEGFANSGREPYCEFYAAQVAQAMGIDAVEYGLARWKGRLCSTCRLFTDMRTGFIPIGNLVRTADIREVVEYCRGISKGALCQVTDMLVFDSVVCNTDRHLGNFGVLVDNRRNHLLRVGPVFDNGLSLFNFAMDEDFADLAQYAQTRNPATHRDFVSYAREILAAEQRKKLRRLLDFRFRRHSRYNFSDKRLKVIERFIQHRAAELLS